MSTGRQMTMGSTRRRGLIALAALAVCAGCAAGDGYRETDEHRPKAGIVNDHAPLVMSGISSSARFGDSVTFTMPVGLLLGEAATEFVASVGSGSGSERVEISPSRTVLDPGVRGVLDVTVAMPSDAASHGGSSLVTIDIALESNSASGDAIRASGRIQIEIVNNEAPLRPTVVDDFVLLAEPQTIDVLSNDVATDGRIESSSLRVIEAFPPLGNSGPVAQDGRISIPEAPYGRGEGARID